VAENIIELIDLTKVYGTHIAVDHLSLTIRKGEVFALLGPNGAGKTTTILMMLGLTDPTSGSVRVCGINSTSNPVEVKKRVGYLPENVGFYDDLTGLQNLLFTARLNSISGNEAMEKAEKLMEKVGLSDASGKKAGKYSRGMLQRLGLADVLIKNPEVIILDEPTLGIDPKGVKEFLELIVELSKEQGLTVLFCSHHLHQVQQVSDRVGLFVHGKLIAEGDIQTLSESLFTGSPYVIEAGINQAISVAEDLPGEKFTTGWLKGILKQIEGVITIDIKDDVIRTECSRDAASDIAKALVEAGAGLNYLNRKEYGLDDIYYRYFEGGEDHV
jgi:ABC-2 type transport system ATP-binding protein